MPGEMKSSKLNTSEDGISRNDARVNADLVVLEPQGESNGKPSNGTDGKSKSPANGNPTAEENFAWHEQLVGWRKQLEETAMEQIEKVGETWGQLEEQTQKATENLTTAVTANIADFSKFQDIFGKKTEQKEKAVKKAVEAQLGLVKGPKVPKFAVLRPSFFVLGSPCIP
jgi:hypothetical protein